mmetsp:Transcript_8394/g.14237  ORF Transcript_8394/g.14237 Transcript_8394/m.14237 type:complete len:245 (-) Transcript_8394:259-993(-)
MEAFLQDLLSPQCYENIFVHKILEADCLKPLISKALGIGIIGGALLLKVPQIVAILSSGTVEGLSPMAFYTELPLSGTNVCYNILQGNPFSTYGEQVFISIQNAILILLLWSYMPVKPSVVFMLGMILFFVAVFVGALSLPAEYQQILPLLSIPLMLFARLSQIVNNFKLKTTGQLSLITTLLNFIGGVARVFTTIQQVGYDYSLLSGFAASILTSGILLLQMVIYRKSKSVASKSDKESKKNK